MKKTVKALLAAMLTLALAFATVGPALAAQGANQNGAIVSDNEESVKAAITKVLTMGQGTATPSATFTFNFSKDTTTTTDNDGATIAPKTNGPTIQPKTVTINSSTPSTDDNINNTKVVEVETADFLQGLTFPESGIYIYDVEEATTGWNQNIQLNGRTRTRTTTTGSGNTRTTTTETMTWSGAKYKVYVYVADKAAGGTYVKAVGVVLKANDDGSTSGGNVGNKVDPTPDDPTDPAIDNSDMKFNNTYNKTVTQDQNPDPTKKAFAVKKVVSDDSFNKAKDFTFKVSLTKPGSYSAANFVGSIIDTKNSNAVINNNVQIPADGTVTDVVLKDGYVLAFNDTPVGTKFHVTEPSISGWTPSIVVMANNVNVTPSGATNDSEVQTVGESVENSVVITNAQSDPTPTGIIMNNLPFVVMIGAAVVAIVALAVVKARKNAVE